MRYSIKAAIFHFKVKVESCESVSNSVKAVKAFYDQSKFIYCLPHCVLGDVIQSTVHDARHHTCMTGALA